MVINLITLLHKKLKLYSPYVMLSATKHPCEHRRDSSPSAQNDMFKKLTKQCTYRGISSNDNPQPQGHEEICRKLTMAELDDEEREILEAFENDELESIANLDAERAKHQQYAAETFKKDKRISTWKSN